MTNIPVPSIEISVSSAELDLRNKMMDLHSQFKMDPIIAFSHHIKN